MVQGKEKRKRDFRIYHCPHWWGSGQGGWKWAEGMVPISCRAFEAVVICLYLLFLLTLPPKPLACLRQPLSLHSGPERGWPSKPLPSLSDNLSEALARRPFVGVCSTWHFELLSAGGPYLSHIADAPICYYSGGPFPRSFLFHGSHSWDYRKYRACDPGV